MSTAHIITLLSAGDIAVNLWRAEIATKDARHAYHRKINEFEAKHGRIEARINPGKPEHAELIAYTKQRFDAYQTAKRKAYNLRRRLNTACQKSARLAAEK